MNTDKLPAIMPLVLKVDLYDEQWKLVQVLIEKHGTPELIHEVKLAIDFARDSALEIRANWDMGIVADFFRSAEEI